VDVCLCVMMEVEVVSFGQSLYSMSEVGDFGTSSTATSRQVPSHQVG
jgi:hypothetical protein